MLLGFGMLVVYLTNGREIPSTDAVPARYLPLALLRGDGLVLDRFRKLPAFAPTPGAGGQALPYYVTLKGGHLVSIYPPGVPLLAVPCYAPQVWFLDHFRPGWEGDAKRLQRYVGKMAKHTAAAVAALAAVALFQVLRRLGLGSWALPATLTPALGSNLWAEASQTLLQHGPAVLALTLSMLLLLSGRLPAWRLCLAGATTAALVCCRPADILFTATIALWVVRYHFRKLAWFLILPVLAGGALIAFNFRVFGLLAGGYQEDFGGSVWTIWSANVSSGAAGTLLSPNRGLFVFWPWVALALGLTPLAVPGRLSGRSVVAWLLWALVPYFLMLSSYAGWWGGWCFGPRFWTDAVPLFAVLLGFGLAWAWSRSRVLVAAFAVTITVSVAFQLIGALCYPSSWNRSPRNVDHDPKRLWDWRDTELRRCLQVGVRD